MPRQPRGELPAGTYHVMTRSAGPITMFVDDNDRRFFCKVFARTLRKTEWTCRAFCLMTTHYHLLVDVAANTLQDGMHDLNALYAQRFNGRHGRTGHLFGDRYRCVPVKSDGHMLSLLRYIARNPVEAGLCDRPSDWLWGSYRGSAGIDRGFPFVTDWILRSYFGDGKDATLRLRNFVDD